MTFSLKFAEVDALFAGVHLIASDKRIAFQGRVKALLRLGLLPEVQLGRGRAAAYGAGEVYLLAIGLELLQLGLTPERAVRVATENLMPIAQAARVAITGINSENRDFAMFLHFDPSGLSALRSADGEDVDYASGTMFYAGTGVIADHLPGISRMNPRLALLNVSLAISYIYWALHDRSESLAQAFEADLQTWLESYPEEADGRDPEA